MNIFKKVEVINKNEENISVPSSRYIFSCLWLLKYHSHLSEKSYKNLFNDVIKKFYQKKYPGFSFIFLLLDQNLKNEVDVIFKKYGLSTNFWMNPYNKKNEDLDYENLLIILKKGEIVHSLFVCAVNILLSNFSRIKMKYSEKTTKINIQILLPNIDSIQILKHASLSRSSLVTNEYLFDGAGYKLGNTILQEILENEDRSKTLFKSIQREIITPEKINFGNLSLLTGNGFSKYITKKYFKDNWLSLNTNFNDVIPLINKRIDSIVNSWKTLLKHFNENKEEVIKIIKFNIKQKEYINSEKITIDIITFLERFLVIQNETFLWMTKIQRELDLNNLNGKNSDLLKFLDNLKILEFNHNSRNYWFHLINYIFIDDYFYNVEAFLSINDKITKSADNREEVDIHYVLNYLYSEAYIEKIWNKGKINRKLDISNKKIKFNNIYTLNYDNLTDQIFGESTHLHGRFESVAQMSDKNSRWTIENVKLIKDEYFSQTFLKRSSVILKGGDYKMGHIKRVASQKINYKYREYLNKLSYDKSDFLIIGTLIIGDPHILDLISNNNNKIYLTYYSKKEFRKLQTLLLISKILKKKAKIYFIDFKKLMKYMLI